MKFLTSITKPEKGISKVFIEHMGRTFVGYAKKHPEDNWSEFTGCRYAEERAEIKALKAELKKKKHDCDECKKFVTAVSQYAEFDPKSPTARAMFRQLNRRIKAVNDIISLINEKEFNLRVAIRQQDGFNNRINQMKLNNNKEK